MWITLQSHLSPFCNSFFHIATYLCNLYISTLHKELSQIMAIINTGFGSLLHILNAYIKNTYGTYIFSQSENRHFLRNALLPLLIYPVCQKFYNLREYVRAMKEHLLRFSCFTCVGGIYKMSCTGSTV